MNTNAIIDSLGIALIITGMLDGIKYRWESCSIRAAGTSKGHSRKFINVAIINDLVRLIYLAFKPDTFLIIASCIALIFMLEMFFTIYKYYPYKNHKKGRPGILKYTWNSFLPNSVRSRL